MATDYSLVGGLEELVGIIEALSKDMPNEHSFAGYQRLSENILDLISCGDEPSRRAGARIMILLMSHGENFALE
jgi:hypothetical protein